MGASKILSPLIAIAALMLVVSGALAAVLLSGGGDTSSEESSAAALVATATVLPATSTPSPTSTPVVGVAIPAELQARFDALPDKLKNDTLDELDKGLLQMSQLEEVIRAYEQRNQSVRVGSVISADDTSLALVVYTTGEHVTVGLTPDTVITRGNTPIRASDLQKDELVMVLSHDDGATAFGIQALGVAAP